MNEVYKASDRLKAKVVIVPSAEKAYMSDKIPYVFRQNSNFFYLTGCLEPDVLLVLLMQPETENFETTLFFPKSDSYVRDLVCITRKKLTQHNFYSDRDMGRT